MSNGDGERMQQSVGVQSDRALGSELQQTEYGLFNQAWECHRLSEICLKKNGVQTGPFGSQLHKKDYVRNGTPIITVEHLGENRILHNNIPMVSNEDRDRLNKYEIKKGDILFSRVGSVDRRSIVRQEEDGWLFSGRCLRVRPQRSLIDPEYLSYFFGLSEFKDYIRRIAVGATMPSLNTKLLSDVPIYHPPLPEQRAIAHILGTLDDKIELNRRMNETLEAMARAIFTSWFVDFDPVRAKAEGRPTGLPEEIAALFPDSFEESELGEIPKGWSSTTLGDVIEIYDSKRIPLNKRQRLEKQGMYPYYGAAGIMDYVDDYLFDGIYVLTGEDGSVVNDCGHSVVQYVWGKFWVNNHAHVLKGIHDICDEQLYLFLKQNDISAFVTGAVQPKLSQGNLKSIPFTIPNESVNIIFSKVVDPLFANIRSITEVNKTLASLRDNLLPKLISGELPVSDTERFVEEAGVI